MWKSFVLELHGEWSEFTDECIGLKSAVEIRTTAIGEGIHLALLPSFSREVSCSQLLISCKTV